MKLVVVREEQSKSSKTRVFARTSSDKVVHVSVLLGSSVRDIVFNGGGVEYYVLCGQEPSELYYITLSGTLVKTVRYKCSSGVLELVSEEPGISQGVSSGVKAVDDLVRDIVEYRKTWASKLCSTPTQVVEYYGIELMAEHALQYVLSRRLKELYLKASSEYTGFILGLLLEAFSTMGFSVRHTCTGACSSASLAEQVKWKGAKLVLEKEGTTAIVEVEKRLGQANPDIYVVLPGKKVVIECKVGPPKTWIKKALKQAKLYKQLAPVVLLLTPRQLSTDEQKLLENAYSYVHTCSPASSRNCLEALLSTIIE